MIGLHQEAPTSAIRYHSHQRWNATQNRTDFNLKDQGNEISPGMAKRLAHYARRRLAELGFTPVLEIAEVHVSGSNLWDNSDDADLDYQVEFRLPEGGIIGVQCIQTSKGWPVLDHGIFCDG